MAEALLDTAERYLDRLEIDDNPDLLTFGEVCSALKIASTLGDRAANRPLDQAYANPSPPTTPPPNPQP
jgi:hypothetical protein